MNAEDQDLAHSLCDRVNSALRRNHLENVTCECVEESFRLVGSVANEADRAIAFALARTTTGSQKIANAVQIEKAS